jgi:phthiocerol/phenolphthiocerol synthesis type-I polyketide synthase C
MRTRHRDIAIIGHACRFPGGASSPESFWDLLISGTDAVTTVPADRFDRRLFLNPDPSVAGKTYTFAAGTLGDVSGFDAGFFGISPREASQMDPQQRLLLEMTWEAMERAGQLPQKLSGTSCAVYVGISSTDYSDRRMGDLAGTDAYFMLGAVFSLAANRISYIFDLNGPSLAIDTACSSSLVALHEAVHALRDGRAPLAVVGGINLLLSPHPFVGFSKAGMLASYGRCRAFDKLATGYVRAEGGGVVILKPLSDAERDGDPILAVIRGVGTNSDGRTHGVALPSSQAQEALLRRVYREARIPTRAISYIEAHGTGTAVGDPAEAQALGQSIGMRRPKSQPLLVGSVKSNIGHLEPASGIAGLIKAIEILRHGVIPPSLHQDEPNPTIKFDELGLRVVNAATPLPRRGGRSIVGVNSFGFGGANAHVAIEAYTNHDQNEPLRHAEDEVLPFVLSGRTEAALEDMAQRTHYALESNAYSWRDLAYTADCRRTHHEHRLILRAADSASARSVLGKFLDRQAAGYQSGEVLSRGAKTALIFVGNGSQWKGMGSRLFAEDQHFRAAIEHVDSVARWRLGWSVAKALSGEMEHALDDTRIAQPLLLALQIGLIDSLKRRGLQFGAVLGHSVGEVAAAYACDALTLEQALHVIRERSNAQGLTRGNGRMMAVSLGAEDAAREIEEFDGAIEIAAINSPAAVTLSGSAEALMALGEILKTRNITHQLLDLDYAFHSKAQDPIRFDLLKGLADLKSHRESLPFYSAVAGDRLSGTELGPEYWWRNIRDPVRFGEAAAALMRDGFRIFVEVGPHPLLQGYLHQQCKMLKVDAQPIVSLSKSDAGASALDRAVDRAFVLGADVAFDRISSRPGKVVPLPTYPWQRERHWYKQTPEACGPLMKRLDGPLLGSRVSPHNTVWENHFDIGAFPFLADHKVAGSVVVPAAVFVEMALEAAQQLFGEGIVDLQDVEIQRPLVLDGSHARVVRFTWTADGSMFRIESRPFMREETWSQHVVGRLIKAPKFSAAVASLRTLPGAVQLSSDEHYDFTRRAGFEYGPVFTVVRNAIVTADTATVHFTSAQPHDLQSAGTRLPPALIDGCLQGIFAILRGHAQDKDTASFIPQKMGRFLFYPDCGVPTHGEVEILRFTPRSLIARCALRDAAGAVVAEIRGLRLSRIELRRGEQHGASLYRTEIVPLAPLGSEAAVSGSLSVARTAIGDCISSSVDFTEKLNEVAIAFAGDTLISLGSDANVASDRGYLLDGVIRIVEDNPASPDATALWRRVVEEHPELIAELTLLGRVGRALPEVLNGADPGIFAPSEGLKDHLNDSAPSAAVGNDAIAKAVTRLMDVWPRTRRIRVLEIGAGTGGLSHRLLSILPADRFSLVLADNDEQAIARLKGKFDNRPDVRVVNVDVSDAMAVRAYLHEEQFDLIVSAYALHCFENCPAVLNVTVEMAAPNAVVLFADFTPQPWLDLTFGVSESWWNRLPSAEAKSRLRTAHELVSLAKDSNFCDVAVDEIGGTLLLSATASEQPAKENTPKEAVARPWVLLFSANDAEIAAALAQELEQRGQTTSRFDVSAFESAGDLKCVELYGSHWAEFIHHHGVPRGLIHLAGLNEVPSSASGMTELQTRRCWSLLAALQGIHGIDSDATLELVLVTNCALALNAGDVTEPGQAPLVGLGRVLQNEFAGASCRIVDLHSEGAGVVSLMSRLADDVSANSDEPETLLSLDARFGARVRRISGEAMPNSALRTQTLATQGGSLDNLHWASRERRPVGSDEVEIEVKAAGLNFRDVMFALGVLPDEVMEGGFAGASLGMEAAGIVTEVGTSVTDIAAGDRVLCFAPACLASHAITKRFAMTKLPDDVDFTSGATMTAAFFTVCYALGHLARLSVGERVLIHGAAGGVGIAALQYARSIGAEIFATAGSDEKRDVVALLGVRPDHIFDSRSSLFADQIMSLTNGEGIDVVLNSIAGEAVTRSLSLLRPFGRFLELGKVDFIMNSRIGLKPLRNNISYFGVDADQVMAEKPALARSIFTDLVDLVDRGELHALPYRVFVREQVVDAFRHLQQSRHIGKIVLDLEGLAPSAPMTRIAEEPVSINPRATYLVTGGLRGLGLATAKWLADKGARRLVLISRNGVVGDDAARILAELRSGGVDVETRACDVCDAAQVQSLIDEISTGDGALKGVVHAAAVYDDGFALDLTFERLRSVLAPKVAGSWALHCATAKLPLDFFLLYSSVSATLGNPGQANYVAANAFLESLAALRRASGLPAAVMALPPVADAGYLTRHAEVGSSLSRLGVRPLPAREVFARLDWLIESGTSGAIFADIDWRKLGTTMRGLGSAKFAAFAVRQGESIAAAERTDVAGLASELAPEELYQLLVEMLAKQIGGILRVSPDKLDVRRSIYDLGMDSLMGLELRMSVSEEFGIELSPMLLTQDVSIHRVAEMLRDQLRDSETGGGEIADGDDPVEGERNVILSRHAEAIPSHIIKDAMASLAEEDPAERSRLIK